MGVKKRPIVFCWDNFGPTHVDRCNAVAAAFEPHSSVIGIELVSKSAVYDWGASEGREFTKITISKTDVLSQSHNSGSVYKLLTQCLMTGADTFFFCHYERLSIFISASILRILGKNVFIMNDSKFDDYERSILRELGKTIFMLPYKGGIAASLRSADYMRFLGVRRENIRLGYDSISVDRVRALGAEADRVEFSERHFIIVARLVAKKNIEAAIDAFSIFRKNNEYSNRRLVICGSGHLEVILKAKVRELGLEPHVDFRGFLQTHQVCPLISQSVALILPSFEEQFGFVIAEAQALGIPVIISDNCGARDCLVRTGVNGYVVEPDNSLGIALFMEELSNDEARWTKLSQAAKAFAARADVKHFIDAVRSLAAIPEQAAPSSDQLETLSDAR